MLGIGLISKMGGASSLIHGRTHCSTTGKIYTRTKKLNKMLVESIFSKKKANNLLFSYLVALMI